jgi:hypothetical protein
MSGLVVSVHFLAIRDLLVPETIMIWITDNMAKSCK